MNLLKTLKILFIAYFFTLSIAPSFAKLQTSLGLMSHKISDINATPKGFSFGVGKIFNLEKGFSIRPTFDFSFVRKKVKMYVNGFAIAESEFSDYSYGLSQRVSYKVPVDLNFHVFADLGVGMSFALVDFDTVFGEREEDTKKLVYYKYNLGLQWLSQTGVGGEFKYGYKGNKDYKGAFVDIAFVYTFS
jgi:hypothetical protein